MKEDKPQDKPQEDKPDEKPQDEKLEKDEKPEKDEPKTIIIQTPLENQV